MYTQTSFQNYINFFGLLLCLLPIFLVLSIAIVEGIIFLVSIFTIYCLIKKKVITKNFKIYIYIFGIFWLILILSSLFSNYQITSIIKSVSYLRFFLLSVGFYIIFSFNLKFIKYFFYVCFFVISILFFDTIYQLILGENSIGFKIIQYARPSSFFKDELKLGSFIVRILPIIMSFYFLRIIEQKIVFFLIFIFSIIIIILSGERASLFILVLYLLGVLTFIKINFKLKISFVLFFIFILFTIFYLNHHTRNRIVNETINEIYQNRNLQVFSENHTAHYKTAIKIFLDHKLFGSGIKSFRHECKKKKYNIVLKRDLENNSILVDSCSTHPHNTYIQLLSETGLLSFTFFLILYFFLIFKLLKKNYYKKKIFNHDCYNFEKMLILSILVNFFPFMPTGNFFNNWLSTLYFLPISFLLFQYNNKLWKNS